MGNRPDQGHLSGWNHSTSAEYGQLEHYLLTLRSIDTKRVGNKLLEYSVTDTLDTSEHPENHDRTDVDAIRHITEYARLKGRDERIIQITVRDARTNAVEANFSEQLFGPDCVDAGARLDSDVRGDAHTVIVNANPNDVEARWNRGELSPSRSEYIYAPIWTGNDEHDLDVAGTVRAMSGQLGQIVRENPDFRQKLAGEQFRLPSALAEFMPKAPKPQHMPAGTAVAPSAHPATHTAHDADIVRVKK